MEDIKSYCYIFYLYLSAEYMLVIKLPCLGGAGEMMRNQD